MLDVMYSVVVSGKMGWREIPQGKPVFGLMSELMVFCQLFVGDKERWKHFSLTRLIMWPMNGILGEIRGGSLGSRAFVNNNLFARKRIPMIAVAIKKVWLWFEVCVLSASPLLSVPLNFAMINPEQPHLNSGDRCTMSKWYRRWELGDSIFQVDGKWNAYMQYEATS